MAPSGSRWPSITLLSGMHFFRAESVRNDMSSLKNVKENIKSYKYRPFVYFFPHTHCNLTVFYLTLLLAPEM